MPFICIYMFIIQVNIILYLCIIWFNVLIRHELDGIDNNKVRAHLMKDACDFKFNVPSASHAGGVWERQIRSVR